MIESLLKQNPKWGARDRRFIAETTYDVVRWWRKILFCGDLDEADTEVLKTIAVWLIVRDQQLGWMSAEVDVIKIQERKLNQKTILRFVNQFQIG